MLLFYRITNSVSGSSIQSLETPAVFLSAISVRYSDNLQVPLRSRQVLGIVNLNRTIELNGVRSEFSSEPLNGRSRWRQFRLSKRAAHRRRPTSNSGGKPFVASGLSNGRLFFGKNAPPSACTEVIANFDERRARGSRRFSRTPPGKVGIRTHLNSWLHV